ncbi:hypothetical protein ACFL3T_02790 [Patescibacteria group bacterium]
MVGPKEEIPINTAKNPDKPRPDTGLGALSSAERKRIAEILDADSLEPLPDITGHVQKHYGIASPHGCNIDIDDDDEY